MRLIHPWRDEKVSPERDSGIHLMRRQNRISVGVSLRAFFVLVIDMARIRTIKPEFFKHEELFLAEQEEKLPLRIAFSGIWTICDREGRFKWRPNTIKLDVLPFDKVDFSRVMDALASRGFIEQYSSAEGDLYGFVPSFLEHQIINNRESQSLIPSPFDASATRDPRGLCALQGKGKERKGREGKEVVADAPFILPDWINKEHWDLWIKTRKGKKMIPEQMQAQVNKLALWKAKGLDYNKALADSAASGWQGLFEPKPAGIQTKHDSYMNTLNQIFPENRNGTNRQIIDISPGITIEGNGESIPEALLGLRESDAG